MATGARSVRALYFGDEGLAVLSKNLVAIGSDSFSILGVQFVDRCLDLVDGGLFSIVTFFVEALLGICDLLIQTIENAVIFDETSRRQGIR